MSIDIRILVSLVIKIDFTWLFVFDSQFAVDDVGSANESEVTLCEAKGLAVAVLNWTDNLADHSRDVMLLGGLARYLWGSLEHTITLV